MLDLVKPFSVTEDGAMTADWVVLTAAIVVLGIAVLNFTSPAVNDVAPDISADLATVDGSSEDASF